MDESNIHINFSLSRDEVNSMLEENDEGGYITAEEWTDLIHEYNIESEMSCLDGEDEIKEDAVHIIMQAVKHMRANPRPETA